MPELKRISDEEINSAWDSLDDVKRLHRSVKPYDRVIAQAQLQADQKVMDAIIKEIFKEVEENTY